MRRRHTSCAVALLALACSGASDPGAADLPEASPAGRSMHGTIRSIGGNTNAAVIPGDDANNVAYRSALGFDLGPVPRGARIKQATLSVTQCRVGGKPYTALGALVVDHLDLTRGLGDDDYAANTITSGIGTLSTVPDTGKHSLDVTAAVRADVGARRSVTGYRLRFSDRDTNGDGTSDFVQIALDRDGTCMGSPVPQLHVAYDP